MEQPLDNTGSDADSDADSLKRFNEIVQDIDTPTTQTVEMFDMAKEALWNITSEVINDPNNPKLLEALAEHINVVVLTFSDCVNVINDELTAKDYSDKGLQKPESIEFRDSRMACIAQLTNIDGGTTAIEVKSHYDNANSYDEALNELKILYKYALEAHIQHTLSKEPYSEKVEPASYSEQRTQSIDDFDSAQNALPQSMVDFLKRENSEIKKTNLHSLLTDVINKFSDCVRLIDNDPDEDFDSRITSIAQLMINEQVTHRKVITELAPLCELQYTQYDDKNIANSIRHVYIRIEAIRRLRDPNVNPTAKLTEIFRIGFLNDITEALKYLQQAS